jgi:hypothetical protein
MLWVGLVENRVVRAQRGAPVWPASLVVQRPAIGVSKFSVKTVRVVGTVLRM